MPGGAEAVPAWTPFGIAWKAFLPIEAGAHSQHCDRIPAPGLSLPVVPAGCCRSTPWGCLLPAAGAHRVGKPAPCNAPLSPTALKQQIFLQQSGIFVTLISRVFFTGAGLAQTGRRAAPCLLRSAAHGDRGRGSHLFPNKTTRTNSIGNKFLASEGTCLGWRRRKLNNRKNVWGFIWQGKKTPTLLASGGMAEHLPFAHVSVPFRQNGEGDGDAHVSRHPSVSGASVHGYGEARTSRVTVLQFPKPPRRVTSPSPGVCHATPPAAAPKFLPSDLKLPARGTDADGKAHAREAFPASYAFGKLMALVWFCLGGDGKPIPAKQTFYYRLFWVFYPFSFCVALSVL